MKKLLCGLICIAMCFCLVACNDDTTKDDYTDHNNSAKEDYNDNNDLTNFDYESKIDFPKVTGEYEYYSYGYHWSTVTVSNYNYDISEQSASQIRIDFDFTCTFDYHGENAAGTSFNFYILVYDSNGVLIKDSIVNETDADVGDTVITEHTILLDKEDVKNGVVIKFGGNK